MNSWQVMCSQLDLWLDPACGFARCRPYGVLCLCHLDAALRPMKISQIWGVVDLLCLPRVFAECLPWPCVNRLQLCLAWSVLYSFMVHPLFHSRTTLLTRRTPLNPGRGVGAATSLAQDSVKTWVNCPCCWRVITPLIGIYVSIGRISTLGWMTIPRTPCFDHGPAVLGGSSGYPAARRGWLQLRQCCGGNGAALGGQRGSEELGHWGGYKKWRIWMENGRKEHQHGLISWVETFLSAQWVDPHRFSFFLKDFCNVFKLFYWKLAPRIDRNWEEWSRISALFLEEKPTKNGSAMVGNMHNHWESSGFSLCRTEGSTFVDRGELAKITANRWSFWGTCSREELKAPSSAMQLSSVPVKIVGP